MKLDEQLSRLELASEGMCGLSPETCTAISKTLRAGLMLYGFIMARSSGKNIPCHEWEKSTVAHAQHKEILGECG